MLRRPRNLVEGPQGQNLAEYTMVISAVMMILFAMGPMIKRGSQSMIKLTADQIGNQADSEQEFDDSGHLESSETKSSSRSETGLREKWGWTEYAYNEQAETSSEVSLNLGFTESGN
jgi:hypothetical protein